MRKGWFRESYRHYLASKGIKTGRVYNLVSLRPKFTENMRENWRGYTEGVASGRFLGIPGITREASLLRKARERGLRQEVLETQQDLQRRFEEEIKAKPFTAEELRRKKMLEAEYRLSSGLRAQLGRMREDELLGGEERSLRGVDDVNLYAVRDWLEGDAADVPAEVDNWIARAENYVQNARVRTDWLRKQAARKIAAGELVEEPMLPTSIGEFEDLIRRFKEKRGEIQRFREYGRTSPLTEFRTELRDGKFTARGVVTDPLMRYPFSESASQQTVPVEKFRVPPFSDKPVVKIETMRPAYAPRKGWGGLNV